MAKICAANPDTWVTLESANSQQEFVLRAIEEQGIHHIRLWFIDILGYLKSVAVALTELEDPFEEGIGFDGSAVEDFSHVSEANTIAQPDPSTLQVMPRLHKENIITSARIFCDIVMPDDQPSQVGPCQVLCRQIRTPAGEGFHTFIHLEIEFFLVESLITDGKPPVPTGNGGYFDQAVYDRTPRLRQKAVTVLEDMGIPAEFPYHENAPGQQETDLRCTNPLTMADNVTSFRYIIKQVVVENGVQATFVSKPFQDLPGNGMRTYISLFEGDTSASHDSDDENQLSDTVKGFITDTLTHVSEISAVTNQWVNFYKRTAFSDEVPTSAAWGIANRSTLVRVPMHSPGKAHSRHVRIRFLDSACNPYLAYSMTSAVGLKEIREGYQLPEQTEDNISELTKRERRAMSYRDLPTSLKVAPQEMERSDLVADALGDHVYESFLLDKWCEWRESQRQMTQWELHTTLDYQLLRAAPFLSSSLICFLGDQFQW